MFESLQAPGHDDHRPGSSYVVVSSFNYCSCPSMSLRGVFHDEKYFLDLAELPFRGLGSYISAFQYEPLDQSKGQIRLFRMDIPHDNVPVDLSGSLETFSLDSCPEFHAVSYEWGPDNWVSHIKLNSSTKTIRANLFSYLWHYREHSKSIMPHHVYLWIDQICINQTSIAERNHQVQLMSRVYRQASSVISWLGCGDICWEELHRESYWNRLCVQQENYLAKHVELMRGITILPASEFVKASPQPPACLTLPEPREVHKPPKYLSLVAAITTFSCHECVDPKDKIYGLLGMVCPEHQIEVDYSLPTLKIFYTALAKVLERDHEAPRDRELQYQYLFETLAARMGLIEDESEMRDPKDYLLARLNDRQLANLAAIYQIKDQPAVERRRAITTLDYWEVSNHSLRFHKYQI
jgi:hypothetical protein